MAAHSLLDIAERSGLAFEPLKRAADRLVGAKLLAGNRRAAQPDETGEVLMKVVLFCGGLGMRLREYSETIPKPMVQLGYRPILWHVMRYYAHYGHKEFILCLGHRGELIKKYFVNYDECDSNDFVLTEGGKELDLLSSDIDDWKITFVDTGLNANIGQRLMRRPEVSGGRRRSSWPTTPTA